jgi:hypothetical protein
MAWSRLLSVSSRRGGGLGDGIVVGILENGVSSLCERDLKEEGRHLRAGALSQLSNRLRGHSFCHAVAKSNGLSKTRARFEP